MKTIYEGRKELLVSIFERNGGHGCYTTSVIIDDLSSKDSVLSILKKDEVPVIICYFNNFHWFLITEERSIYHRSESDCIIYLEEIVSVTPVIREEMKRSVFDKVNFSNLEIKSRSNINCVVQLEKGLPYQGVYQVMSFIANKNKSVL